MSEKRKDHKGRILKTGESQRKDLLYQYRYKGLDGKRKTIYDPDLQNLRKKEVQIQASLLNEEDYSKGNITVLQLVEKYLFLHQGVKYSTKRSYQTIMNFLRTQDICYRKICDIRKSDMQDWIVNMHKDGRKYNTINLSIAVMSPAFQLACDENIIRKNPLDFKLSNVIPKDEKEHIALTKEQQKSLLEFTANHRTYKKYLDLIVVLLGTGLRQGEISGLTLDNLDFQNKVIRVDHQLRFNSQKGLYISSPKTKAGYRNIPMTDKVYESLQNMIKERSKYDIGYELDGYKDFLFIGRTGKLKEPKEVWRIVKAISDRYRKEYPDTDMPSIHPHLLRHTFCTNMAHAGMDVKTLQYIMGHSDLSITLSVYSHTNFEDINSKLKVIMNEATV